MINILKDLKSKNITKKKLNILGLNKLKLCLDELGAVIQSEQKLDNLYNFDLKRVLMGAEIIV